MVLFYSHFSAAYYPFILDNPMQFNQKLQHQIGQENENALKPLTFLAKLQQF